MSALNTLKSAFVSALELPVEDITENLAYSKHPKWDSTGHMILIAEIENRFDIMLDTDDIIAMSSFAVAVSILQKYDVNISL